MAGSTLHQDRPIWALSLRLMAVATFAMVFAIVKYADQHGVHIIESLFYRFLFAGVIIGGWTLSRHGLDSLKTHNFRGHFVRAIFGLFSMALGFYAVTLLPLAEAATIKFTIPLITTVMSVIFLSEFVGIKRWLAVIVGFIGVLVAIQPGQNDIPLFGAAIALTGAFTTSYVMILIRQLSKTESAAAIVFYYMALGVPILAVLMLWFGQWHSPKIFGLLFLMGILSAFGMWALSESLRYANLAVAMPMDYANLLFSTALGFFIWGHVPVKTIWYGAPIIIASGVYIAMREHKRREAIKKAAH